MSSRTFFSVVVLLALWGGARIAPDECNAQDFGTMIQQQLQQGNARGQQMQQMQNNIVQQNMQNPRVQQMYQQHVANGGQMSFQEFAYAYAGTGGFTPEGTNRWNQNERSIQQRDQAAVDAYRQNQGQNARAMQEMQNRQDEIAHARGNLLNGTTDYVDPGTGKQYNLPHTAQGGDTFHDSNSDQNFQRDGQGNYRREDPSGYNHELEEEE